ncbi:hypothetical protein NEHOM01_1136 [Nematocida homosporus]|uniref:uncharacterized protein n=1 Tax=Nematocida homosporus TaxID=1912981 RepID=UPI0022202DDB|nr:uncharacterized protein NEHOM01_1136 [Nematocida homosporus]KAI5185886.1 hypothetical protein NEHOM01_1136 [Nematocida homosporus]
MELLQVLSEDEFPVKTYSMSLIDVELFLKTRGSHIHAYHPELEKKIQEIGGIMRVAATKGAVSVERFLDGLFQEKLVAYGEGQVKAAVELFDQQLQDKFRRVEKQILSAPKPRQFKIRKEEFTEMIIAGCRAVRGGRPASRTMFSSDMLYDVYVYAQEGQSALQFLELQHRDKVLGERSLEAVSAYANSRYSRSMFKIEMYNNRAMFIELFHCLRAGMYEEAVQFVESHEGFFTEIRRNFTEALLRWMYDMGMSSKRVEKTTGWEETPTEEDDPFKLWFFQLFSGDSRAPRAVLATLEDFLWNQILAGETQKRLNGRLVGNEVETFRVLCGAISSSKLFAAAMVLGQWKDALEILHDESFKTAEVLFLALAIARRIAVAKPGSLPVKRGRVEKNEVGQAIDLFVKIVQRVSSLFLKPEEKLSVVQLVVPFIAVDWVEDLVAEVFIAAEEFGVLGGLDGQGRKHPSTLQEYIDIPLGAVIEKISVYYMHGGDLQKALKVSYLGNGQKTLEILIKILTDKIKKKAFSEDGLQSIVEHFNNRTTNILWSLIAVGQVESSGELATAIRSTGLIPDTETSSVFKKAQSINDMPAEVQAAIPFGLAVIARKIAEFPSEENRKLGKAVLLLAGMLEVDTQITQEIVSAISIML